MELQENVSDLISCPETVVDAFKKKPAHRIAAVLIHDVQTYTNSKIDQSEDSFNWFSLKDNRFVTFCSYLFLFFHIIVFSIIETSPDYKLPSFYICIAETTMLLIHSLRIVLERKIESDFDFHNNNRHLMVIFLSLLSSVDIILCISFKLALLPTGRFTRFVRCLFFILSGYEGRNLRRALASICRTLLEMKYVLFLYAASVFIFTFLAWRLFGDLKLTYPNNTPYFQSYTESLWDMYVLITTANFPDIMMPAYSYYAPYSLFFVTYIIINLTIILNILLAVIFSNYKRHLKEEMHFLVKEKTKKINEAFKMVAMKLIDLEIGETDEQLFVDKNIFYCLMKLYNRSFNSIQITAYFNILDQGKKGYLERHDFAKIADLLEIHVTTKSDRVLFFEKKFPVLWKSKCNQRIVRICTGMVFNLCCDLLNILNLMFTVFFESFGRRENFYLYVEWCLLIVFTVQILGKIYALGVDEFYFKGRNCAWNWFDTLVVIGGLCIFTVYTLMIGIGQKRGLPVSIDLFIILKLSRAVILISHIKGFRSILSTVGAILPSLTTYGVLVLSVFYMFTMVGIEMFQGLIKNPIVNGTGILANNCGNPALNGTDFALLNYCKNNFNDFLHGMLLMFELMIVNQWHVITQGFVIVYGSGNAKFFFIAFHIIGVLLVMNIFTAFILEVFLHVYEEPQKPPNEVELKHRIHNLGYATYDGYEMKTETKKETLTPPIHELENLCKLFKSTPCMNRLLVYLRNQFFYSWYWFKFCVDSTYKIERINTENTDIVFHFIPQRSQPLTLVLYNLLSSEDGDADENQTENFSISTRSSRASLSTINSSS